ncbi:MAG: SGNH/GDSL hydrolase family protein [Cyanobacteriota bacterium]|nr:SGNH/GDSL hydrolase family protein [Cyanobacteriota bacterium]
MKVLLLILAVVVGLVLMLEVGLRALLGLGNPLIYIADAEIGYRLAPNQRTRRFGNRIAINEYSMRSPPISLKRSPSTLRVLLLGDSVANGAWWTDQDKTISALIEAQLEGMVGEVTGESLKIQPFFERVEALNASANSWGPHNELAYLKRFGTFEAQAVVLLINTDDLFATAPTSAPVGRDRNYPNHKPLLALVEVFRRYVLPALPLPEMPAVKAKAGVSISDREAVATLGASAPPSEEDRVGFNLEAIRQIQALANVGGAQFLLVMTPLLREIGEPGSRDYEVKARMRLTDFAQNQQITYLDFLAEFNGMQTPEALYRDHIHLSPQGNQKVSELITRSLRLLLPPVVPPATTTKTTSSD